MIAQPALPGMVSKSDHAADLRSRGDDPTPRGVVRAVLEASIGCNWQEGPFVGDAVDDVAGWSILRGFPSDSVRVLDVCAGFGCWASELRRLAAAQGWPVHITGVELDVRKREHLAKWCDEVEFCDWRDSISLPLADEREWTVERWTPMDAFDIVIGNPDFAQLTHDDADQSMPAVLLRHAPAVLLLHTQQAFLKSEAGRAAWRLNPPAASWLIPGGVKFRGAKEGADSRCYQVTLWLRGHSGPCSVYLLGDLSPAERSWTQLPGTEDAETAKAMGLPMVGQP